MSHRPFRDGDIVPFLVVTLVVLVVLMAIPIMNWLGELLRKVL